MSESVTTRYTRAVVHAGGDDALAVGRERRSADLVRVPFEAGQHHRDEESQVDQVASNRVE
jgi:hypothetical protein